MIRTHRIVLAITLALGAAPLAHAADLPSARSLIDAHIEAVGGRKALAASSQGTSKVQVEIVEAGVKMEMTLYGRGSDRASVATIPNLGEFRNGYSDGVAWSMDPMNGPRLLVGAERSQQIEQGDARYATYDKKVIASTKTLALAESEGRPCYRVSIKWISGREVFNCYSSENGLLLSTESIGATAMGELKQISHMSDYQAYGKVKMPSKIKSQAAGMTQLISVVSIDSTPAPAEAFVPPPAIQALIKKAAEAPKAAAASESASEAKPAQ